LRTEEPFNEVDITGEENAGTCNVDNVEGSFISDITLEERDY